MTTLMKFPGRFKLGASSKKPMPTSEARLAEHTIDYQHEDDESLVARVQHGEQAAFDELVRRYKERLYATVYHMTSNHEDANDLVQDAFIKAYKSIGSFKRQSSFYTWVYRIAVNRTINFLKRRRNRNHFSLDDVDGSIQTDPDFVELMSHVTPRREVGLTELQARLNEALQKLSEPHRAVVTMHDIQGMTHADIAKVMNCSEGTVRSRLFYARQQLQGLLSDYL
ncbi:MAG TPA: sigma-70 family RNA polymerase sigma factor [Verrucomicrobiae bacterium]|nr:sigma-70 family RNA polymerase sigma factor [Verrucomicrobiae bacterium]